MLSDISLERLSQVQPELSRRVQQLADKLEAEGVSIQITQGLRTWKQQTDLYAQGRTTPGKIVTNAEPGYSWHSFALAVDFVPLDAQGEPIWDTDDPSWGSAISAAPTFGLVSGATWTHFPDFPHLQPQELPVTPTDEDRQDFKDAGTIAIWNRYFPA